MNARFLISVAVIFVLFVATGFLVHGLILSQDYAQSGIFRTELEQQRYFPFMLLANLVAAFAFVWIYIRGKENKTILAQGIRYGLAIAGVSIVPRFLIYYAVQPMPAGTVVKQIVFDTVGLVIAGIVVARLND